MSEPRIASFLPAATEMVYLLGLGENLVGRSHECDYPPEALSKPVLVDCALDLARLTTQEIDEVVTRQIGEGKSLYKVDEERLARAAPTLLITQNLCQVCGPSGNEVSQVLKSLRPVPEILWQTPKNFEEVLQAVVELGRATGRLKTAQDWSAAARLKVQRLSAKTSRHPRKMRASFIEWVDPVYCGGHWIPEMLRWAGGEDPNSRLGTDSVRIPWQSVVDSQPEVLFVSPCGFKTDQAFEQAKILTRRPGWSSLPAVKAGRVFAVDANSYFARPGPRLVDGVELLAHLMRPDEFPWSGPPSAYRQITTSGL
jgi:iron complex transport system substrate-binding protein